MLHGASCNPLILSTETATATFLLRQGWKGLSINAYIQIIKEHSEHCTILENIPQAWVTYRRHELWIGNIASTPAPQWDLKIIVIWNKEAQYVQFDRNPRWYAALTNATPEAI